MSETRGDVIFLGENIIQTSDGNVIEGRLFFKRNLCLSWNATQKVIVGANLHLIIIIKAAGSHLSKLNQGDCEL